MANLEVLALDTVTPQIRAPGAGDGYSVPRDMTLASGTTLTAPTVNATTVDATNVEVTNVKAKDGTAAIAIADSTGAVTVSTPTVVSVNSSSDALRITQVGAGNALVVEDSANPDASPLIVNADGNLVAGADTSYLTGLGTRGRLVAVNATADTGQGVQVIKYRATASLGADIELAKSNSSTIGTNTAVASGNTIGTLWFTAADGTGFIPAATIKSEVDGTPGTNDMPGRLVFSTTADGAATPTERMRIDSSGNVGIGGTANATDKVTIAGTLPTSSNVSIGLINRGTVPSGTTSSASIFRSGPTTEAASFTITVLNHFIASPQAFGAGSTVSTQYGFHAASPLTGATNNYGFYSNIASGSGRYNFYAAGSADNYFAGDTGIGTTSPRGTLNVASNINTRTTVSGDADELILENSDVNNCGMTILSGTNNTGNIFFGDPGGSARGQITFDHSDEHMHFSTANAERMRITSAGNVKIGGTAARATTAGTNQLVLFNGTAPVGTLTNGVSFYSASGEANVMDAAGNATLLSPHDSETNEWIFRSKHTPTGKVLKIDVEKMLRFINEHFDLDMVQEWTE